MKSRISCSVSSIECTEDEQPGHLAQRPELEDRVVQGGLALQQDAPELEHHAEPERQRHRHRPHLAGDGRVGVDDDLGLPAAQPGHLHRAVSNPPAGPTRGRLSVGETSVNQICSLWNRRTSATRQRSNSSPSVRESRQAAAKALGRLVRAAGGVEAILYNTRGRKLLGAGAVPAR